MNIKDCKGCSSEQHTKEYNTTCGVLHSRIKQESTTVKRLSMCPCVECLIKMICNRVCKQHKEYMNNLIKSPGLLAYPIIYGRR